MDVIDLTRSRGEEANSEPEATSASASPFSDAAAEYTRRMGERWQRWREGKRRGSTNKKKAKKKGKLHSKGGVKPNNNTGVAPKLHKNLSARVRSLKMQSDMQTAALLLENERATAACLQRNERRLRDPQPPSLDPVAPADTDAAESFFLIRNAVSAEQTEQILAALASNEDFAGKEIRASARKGEASHAGLADVAREGGGGASRRSGRLPLVLSGDAHYPPLNSTPVKEKGWNMIKSLLSLLGQDAGAKTPLIELHLKRLAELLDESAEGTPDAIRLIRRTYKTHSKEGRAALPAHRDGTSGPTILLSLGQGVRWCCANRFDLADPEDEHERLPPSQSFTVTVDSGDVLFFDGDMLLHQVISVLPPETAPSNLFGPGTPGAFLHEKGIGRVALIFRLPQTSAQDPWLGSCGRSNLQQ